MMHNKLQNFLENLKQDFRSELKERDERICLYKSLWSDAEAAVDSMLFEMKLIKMEFEMEKLKMRNRGTLEFSNRESEISASTDNTLKLWDFTKANPSGLSNNAYTLTYTGHTNEKIVVGFSVMDGYIACGSEINSVFAYYKSLPMPMGSHRFGFEDPISSQEMEDDSG